jgi:hypothetical protein
MAIQRSTLHATSHRWNGCVFVGLGNEVAAIIGPYSHATLYRSMVKKDGTRMLKVVCPECGYTVRTTAKWPAVGVPSCACWAEMEVSG